MESRKKVATRGCGSRQAMATYAASPTDSDDPEDEIIEDEDLDDEDEDDDLFDDEDDLDDDDEDDLDDDEDELDDDDGR